MSGLTGSVSKPLPPKPKMQEMKINNRKDVDRFIDTIAKKMEESSQSRKQKKYFLQNLLPKICKNLSLEDMNDIKKGLNIICNKKAKDPSKRKKKKGGRNVAMSSGGHLQDYSKDQYAMFDDFDSYF